MHLLMSILQILKLARLCYLHISVPPIRIPFAALAALIPRLAQIWHLREAFPDMLYYHTSSGGQNQSVGSHTAPSTSWKDLQVITTSATHTRQVAFLSHYAWSRCKEGHL